MSDTREAACLRCDDTGWQRHPAGTGYCWCVCAKGALFRTAHLGRVKRGTTSKWARVGDKWVTKGGAA